MRDKDQPITVEPGNVAVAQVLRTTRAMHN